MGSEQQSPYLSIVIPCWNEAGNLEHGVLDEVDRYLTARTFSWEVIVVDDGSTDGSPRLLRDFMATRSGYSLHYIPHGGKPAAVWAGIQQARGELVCFIDMDQSTPIGELDKLLPWYDQGYDVVIGSRGTAREGTSIFRKLGSFAFLMLRQMMLLRQIRDTQCGFKSCRRQPALEVFPYLQFFREEQRPSGWRVSAYDVELLYLLDRAGYRIREVEVSWRDRDRSETKRQRGGLAQYVSESLEMAREVFRVKRNSRDGLYDGVTSNSGPARDGAPGPRT